MLDKERVIKRLKEEILNCKSYSYYGGSVWLEKILTELESGEFDIEEKKDDH